MNSSAEVSALTDLPASCSESCRYAESTTGNYLDWIWCSRPGALNRVRRVGEECPAFKQARAVADADATRSSGQAHGIS